MGKSKVKIYAGRFVESMKKYSHRLEVSTPDGVLTQDLIDERSLTPGHYEADSINYQMTGQRYPKIGVAFNNLVPVK